MTRATPRLKTSHGKTTERKSQSLRAYQRRTLAADALTVDAVTRVRLAQPVVRLETGLALASDLARGDELDQMR